MSAPENGIYGSAAITMEPLTPSATPDKALACGATSRFRPLKFPCAASFCWPPSCRPADPAEKIVLIGHSKGAVDILHFLVNHPQQAGRVRAAVSVSGPVNGSPLADSWTEYTEAFSPG